MQSEYDFRFQSTNQIWVALYFTVALGSGLVPIVITTV